MWAKLHAAKALEETANVLRQQGQLDDLVEKTLKLLDRMKSTITDSELTSRVRAVFKAMPNPQIYKQLSKRQLLLLMGIKKIDNEL